MLTWQDFLLTQRSSLTEPTRLCSLEFNNHTIIALKQLSILTLSGVDAADFLQGQITYNIRELSDSQSRFTALCDAKGKVIASFILVKTDSDFMLIVPTDLLNTLKQRLQRYLLRANVTITDSSKELCLIGLSAITDTALFTTKHHETYHSINFIQRELIIAPVAPAISLWQEKLQQGFQAQNSAYWQYADIMAGIPWLTLNTSEQFIPQMLNIDKLGGISFNKGCYTGQEIVARTHYLGNVTRSLLLAEVITTTIIASGAVIIDAHQHTVGKVLMAQLIDTKHWLLLLVLSHSEIERKLYLSDNSELNLLLTQFSYDDT